MIVNRFGNLARAWILAFGAALMSSVAALAQTDEPYFPTPDELPPGPWQDQCWLPRFEGHYLVTSCDIDVGGRAYTRWDMTRSFGPLIVCRGDLTDEPHCNTGSPELPGNTLPGGPWRQFCDFVRWEAGPTIVAMCPNDDNILEEVRIDAPNFRPFLMACDLDIVEGEDGGVCWDYTPDMVLNVRATPPLPPGDWSQTCSVVEWDGRLLQADCLNAQGQSQRAATYADQHTTLTNCDGQMFTPAQCREAREIAAAQQPADGFPPGTWSQSCTNPFWHYHVFLVSCPRPDGTVNEVAVIPGDYSGPYANCYGALFEGTTCPALPAGGWRDTCRVTGISADTIHADCYRGARDYMRGDIAMGDPAGYYPTTARIAHNPPRLENCDGDLRERC